VRLLHDAENLSALSYANGFTVWHYRTADLAAEIDNTGYFGGAAEMMRVGDFVLVNAGVGTVPTHGVLVVVASGNIGNVDVANATSFAGANSD
jgi:hypothetical protein